ncbi:hypothetical protein [Luteolibacter soli]|uniref:Uncharacterized protein n=1 Tax=Luteolibacter soli TaxID=3135280 RepID=A0ABU9B2T4_9BACT
MENLEERIHRIKQLQGAEVKQLTREVLLEPNAANKWYLLGLLCQNISSSNWKDIEQAFKDESAERGTARPREYAVLMQSIGAKVGREAVENWMGNPILASMVVEGWSLEDPDRALQFLDSLDESKRKPLETATLKGMARNDPRTGFEYALNSPARNDEFLEIALQSATESLGLTGAVDLLNASLDKLEQSGQESKVNPASYFDVIARKVGFMSNRAGDPKILCDFLMGSKESYKIPADILGEAAGSLARNQPTEALAWWQKMVPEADRGRPNAPGLGGLYDGLMKDPKQLEDWLLAHTSDSLYDGLASKMLSDKRTSAGLSDKLLANINSSELKEKLSKEREETKDK